MNRRNKNSRRLALLSAGLLALTLQLLWVNSAPQATDASLSIGALSEPARASTPSIAPPLRPLDSGYGTIGQPEGQMRGSTQPSSISRRGTGPRPDPVVTRFRVIGGPAKLPLAGVRVHAGGGHLVGHSDLDNLPSARAFQCDPVPVAIERLPVFESDSMGLVEVPLEGSAGVVAAVFIPATVDSPALEAWVHPTEAQIRKRQSEPFPLTLRKRQEWTLRAVDRWGRGRSGVEVKAQLLRSADFDAISEGGAPSEFPFSGAAGHPSTRYLGTTDDEGLLTYARAPLLPLDSRGNDPIVAVLLVAEVPAGEQVPVLIDKVPAPSTVIELPMPASGQVAARLLDHDERPLPGWHEIHVLRRSTEEFSQLKTVLAQNGVAMIGGLPTVESLRIRLGLGDGPAADVAGLQHDGSHSSAEIRAGPHHAVLLGRILDKHSQPLANQRLAGQGAGWDITCASTGPDGRFSVLVPLALDRGLPQAVVFQLDPERENEALEPRPQYRVRLDIPLEAATYDLGDLSPSGPHPLLAAGRITIAPDVVCDGYDLQVEFRAPDNTWRELHGIEVSLTGEGHFTIHGDPEPWTDHRLLLRVRRDCQLRPDPIEFTPGARDIHIKADPGSSLSVRVATPLTVGSGRSLARVLDFVLEEVGGAASSMAPESLAVSKYGNVEEGGLVALHWHGLRSGSFRLRVLARGADSLLAEIPQIGVSSRIVTEPRVLDLTGVLYRFRLDFVGSDGSPLRHASARLNWGSGSIQASMNLRGPTCVGIAPRVSAQITTRAKGYVTDSRPLTPGPQQIQLQPTSLVSTLIQVTGLNLPEGVHADLVWGPANLPRAVEEASGFGPHEDTRRAVEELRVGKRALVGVHSVEIQQPVRPGPTSGLRLILALSALPPPHQPNVPTRILLDEMPGWLLSNPQPTSATLEVDVTALQETLTVMGRD